MANETSRLLTKHLRSLTTAARADGLMDRELVERFAVGRDEESFAALVRRHGPMVLRVCRRVLHDGHDAEDVFQATFLVLSRKASSLRRRDSVGCFLHGVAYRLALKARTQLAQQRKYESQAAVEKHADDPLAELTVREAQAILDEELARLPEKYRAPLVLCYLEGQTRDEAARQLGWSARLVKNRLEQARERVRHRLTRRGLTLPAALTATLLAEEATPVSAALVRAAVLAVRAWPGNGVSSSVALLAQNALGGTATGKANVVLLGLLLLTGALAVGLGAFAPPRSADEQAGSPAVAEASLAQQVERQRPPRTDRYGDPLPSGALARLGTMRWRHGNQVTAVAFSHDGSTLASGSWDDAVHLWDAKTGKLLRILSQGQHPGMVTCVFFTPDGKQLISCGGRAGDNSACVWDLSTGEKLRRWPIPGGWKLALSPDGKLLAGIGNVRPKQDSIGLWEIATGKMVRELLLEGVQDSVTDLAFSPDGKRLVSGGGSTLRLFDVENGKQLRTFGEGKRINSVAFSLDGKTVAIARFEGSITLWNVATGEKLRQYSDITHGSRVAFSHDGKTLAGCKVGFTKIILWDLETGKKVRELPGQHYQVWDLAFSPDDKILAVGNLDSQVRLWDVTAGKELSSVGEHRGTVNVLAFTDRDQGVASVSAEGKVCHWDAATSQVLRKFQEEGTQCYCGDLSPDKRTLALGDDAGVHLFEWSTGKKLRLLKGHKLQIWDAVFSPKGDMLASCANMDQHILIWDVGAGKELRRILTPYVSQPLLIRSLAWSPDGKTLASVGGSSIDNPHSGTVYLWDPSTGKRLRAWALQRNKNNLAPGVIASIAFSRDGMLLAAADGDNSVVIWDTATGTTCARLPGHRRAICALAFSPDGRMLASGGDDRTIRLWELSTWKERRCYEGHLGGIGTLAFSSDGMTLASASSDTSVLLWSVMDGDPRRSRPNLVLSPREMEKLWDDLASEDAARAWRAVCVLVHAPKEAISWLKEHLKPPTAAEVDRIKQLIAELDNDQFTVRQQAARDLEKLGQQAEPALRNALEKRPSLEVRRQVEQLLAKLQEPVQAAGTMRELRSLEVLEHSNTAEARALLRSLAEGSPEARLTREAKAALERLAHQSNTAR